MSVPTRSATAVSAGRDRPPVDIESWLVRVEERLWHVLSQTEDPKLLEMASKMIGSGGKRLRPRVGLLSYAACGGRELVPAMVDSAAGIELIHTATLVHDDIIDGGEFRRGRAATHKEYGLGHAIVAGDFLFIQGLRLSAALDERVIAITSLACTRLAEGELLESRSLGDSSTGLDQYLRTISKKTAAPLQAACEIGAYLAGADETTIAALGRYGHNLGIAFQISDDLLDVRGDDRKTGKPVGIDLRVGVPNLPSILTLRSTHNQRFRLLVSKEVKTEGEIRECLDAILRSGSVEQAERMVAEYVDRAVGALSALPDSSFRVELIEVARGQLYRER